MSQYATVPTNYTPFGTGLGLLAPFISKLFGGGNNQQTPSTGTPVTAPQVANAPGAMAATNNNMVNMAGGASSTPGVPSNAQLGLAATLFPGAAASDLPAYIAANPDMFSANNTAAPAASTSGGGLSNLLGAIGGSGTGAGTNPSATNDRPYTLGPAVAPSPQGGGGPNAGALQATQQMLASRMMPMSGGAPSPVGMGGGGGVGQQQLLAMLMSRLGSGGGLG